MKFRKTWFCITGALSAVGLLLTGFATKATAQWTQSYRTMHRGMIAQSILNKGWGGHPFLGLASSDHLEHVQTHTRQLHAVPAGLAER